MKRNFMFLAALILGALFLFFTIDVAYLIGQVTVEFYYWDPSEDPNMCWTCPGWLYVYYDFLNKTQIVDDIESTYGDYVSVIKVNVNDLPDSPQYPRNSIVVNREHVFWKNFTIDDVKAVINAYLEDNTPPFPPSPSMSILSAVVMAYTFGFFETFSPCLIALLSFVLSYTIVENSSFKRKLLQVVLFAVGFASAAILIFLTIVLGLVAMSLIFGIQQIVMFIVLIFAIIFGLDLLGLNLFQILGKRSKKLLVQDVAKKYAFSYSGLALLGFLFYFLDPCIAPVFVFMLSTFSSEVLFGFLPLLLCAFAFGVLTPFVIVGFVSGSISKFSRNVYRYKNKIRAISGAILICYAVYLLFTLLFL